MAIIGSAPFLAYWLLSSLFFAAMALLSDSGMRQQAGFLAPFLCEGLSPLAMFVFLVFLYREASGRSSAGGRRKAAMVATAVTVLGVVSYALTFHGNSSMSTGMLAFYLTGFATWTVFYVVFAGEADPLGKRTTRNLAAFLAALTVVNGVISAYGFCKQLTHFVPPLLSGYYLLILMITFERLCPLVFLVVVWRYRPAPPAPGDRAEETT
jgi:hypothetical protein